MRRTILMTILLFGVAQSLMHYKMASIPSFYYNYNINSIVDKVLPIMSTVMKKIGLDPMAVPSITDDFEINVLSTFNRTMNVHLPSGNLSKLAIIQRHGNTSLFFRDDLIYLRVGVIHNHLQGRFHYSVYSFPVTFRGILNVTIYDALTTVYFAYDWNNASLSLKSININDIRSIIIDLDNDSLFDKLGSSTANAMAPLIKKKIIHFGEKMAAVLINKNINAINAELLQKLYILNDIKYSLPNFILSRKNNNVYQTISNVGFWLPFT